MLALLLLTAARPPYNLKEEPYFTHSLICGPYSLLFICKELGVDADYNEIYKATGFRKGVGTSLLGIYNAALEKGMDVTPVKTDIEGLRHWGNLSIVFVMDNHFTVVTHCTEDSVTIRDYPRGPKTLPIERFKRVWNGEALIFNMPEKQKENIHGRKTSYAGGPKVEFTSHLRDFGIIERGEVLRHTFTFTNTGTEPLIVRARSTCKCTASLLSNESTQPGESGEIKVEYNTKDKNGISNVKIICRTNDPDNKLVTLQLLAEVSQEVFPVPEEFYVGNIVFGESIRKVIKVYKSTRSDFAITGIDCPEGISARILEYEESQHYNYIIPVELSFNGTMKLGIIDQSVVIHTNDATKKRIDIPVVGTVESPFKIFPPRLLVDNITTNTTMTREVTITHRSGKPFSLEEILVSDDNISVDADSRNTAGVHKLKVTIHAPSKALIYRGSCDLRITDTDGMLISFPVIARVVD